MCGGKHKGHVIVLKCWWILLDMWKNRYKARHVPTISRPVLENPGQEVVESGRRHRLCKPGDLVHFNIIFFFILQSKVGMRGVENLAFGEIFLDWSVQDRFKRVQETQLEGWCTGGVKRR